MDLGFTEGHRDKWLLQQCKVREEGHVNSGGSSGNDAMANFRILYGFELAPLLIQEQETEKKTKLRCLANSLSKGTIYLDVKT